MPNLNCSVDRTQKRHRSGWRFMSFHPMGRALDGYPGDICIRHVVEIWVGGNDCIQRNSEILLPANARPSWLLGSVGNNPKYTPTVPYLHCHRPIKSCKIGLSVMCSLVRENFMPDKPETQPQKAITQSGSFPALEPKARREPPKPATLPEEHDDNKGATTGLFAIVPEGEDSSAALDDDPATGQ